MLILFCYGAFVLGFLAALLIAVGDQPPLARAAAPAAVVAAAVAGFVEPVRDVVGLSPWALALVPLGVAAWWYVASHLD